MTQDVALTLRAQGVKAQVSIYQALEIVGVSLPSGHYTQQIICPFHADRHPSARIYPDHFHCFTCGKSWDAIDVIQEKFTLGYADALSWMESNFSIAPTSANVHDTVRAMLKVVPKSGIKEQFLYTEKMLIKQRDLIPHETYHKLSFALDLLLYQLSEKQITPEGLLEGVNKVMAAIGKLSVGVPHGV